MIKKKTSAFLVFISSLFWAGDSPFRKPLLTGGLTVTFIAFLEHLLNGIVSLPLLIKKRIEFRLLTWKKILGLIYIGAGASALAAILFVQGAVVMNYNFTVVALLQKFQPVFAILLAAIFLRERISAKFWLLAVPALIGGYLVTFGLASPGVLWHSGTVMWQGAALALLAALLWAGGTVVGRGLLADLSFEFVTGMRFVFGFIFLFFYELMYEKFQFGAMTPLFWRNVFIIAMLTGFFALLLYYFGLRRTRASVATLMELGYPLALTVVNWIFLQITLNAWQIAGAVVLLLSVTLLVLYGGNREAVPGQFIENN